MNKNPYISTILDYSKVLIYKGFFMWNKSKNVDFTRFLKPESACNSCKTLIVYTLNNEQKDIHYDYYERLTRINCYSIKRY